MKKSIDARDEAFIVVQNTECIYKDCTICSGTGELRIKGKNFVCPQCGGTGREGTSFTRWIVRGPATLDQVFLSKEDGFQEWYVYDVPVSYLYGTGSYKEKLKQEDIFGSFRDAENEAARRNGKDSGKLVNFRLEVVS